MTVEVNLAEKTLYRVRLGIVQTDGGNRCAPIAEFHRENERDGFFMADSSWIWRSPRPAPPRTRARFRSAASSSVAARSVARTRNRTLGDRDPTAHAEMLAIRRAAAAIGSERLVDCDLFVTLEPCTMCAGALSFARIRRLYYGAADPKGGAVESGVRFFSAPTCHHRPDIYGGIGEQESAALLRRFFAERR